MREEKQFSNVKVGSDYAGSGIFSFSLFVVVEKKKKKKKKTTHKRPTEGRRKKRKKEDDNEEAEGEVFLPPSLSLSFIHHHFFLSRSHALSFLFLVRVVKMSDHYRLAFELKIEKRK
jgi:hypothetical protein